MHAQSERTLRVAVRADFSRNFVVDKPHSTASSSWGDALNAWAIPQTILDQAVESPWIHPPELFEIPEVIATSPSHERALEALGAEASVLDIGCGGGIATYALVPRVRRAVGVDHQPEMLRMFEANGKRLGVEVETIEGFWPTVASEAPICDVVAAHHVAYNVADIVPFLTAMIDRARHRIVLELPAQHPLSTMSSAWEHFWQLERPSGPSPTDLVAVLKEMGVSPNMESWNGTMRTEQNLAQAAHFMRIRLCLVPEREPEVYEFLATQSPPLTRQLVCIWWDRNL